MAEEGMISMNEFKVIVEKFEESQKRIVEYMTHEFGQIKTEFGEVYKRFDQQDKRMLGMMEQIAILKEGQTELKSDVFVLKEDMVMVKSELRTLADGQEAIRTDLRKKVDFDDFVKLETRVSRLENKAA